MTNRRNLLKMILNDEEREDTTKGGLNYIEPAYKAQRGAFST
jgi:hypothetical protein